MIKGSCGMKFNEYDVPDDYHYHPEHSWAKKKGADVLVGWTDFAQKLAGQITTVIIPDEGDHIVRDKTMGSIETGKWVGKLYAPVTAEVIEVNEEVLDDANIINMDPYGGGWILRVAMDDESEFKELLGPEKYVTIMKSKLNELGMDKK
jgi:glycine cleavage system H protein